MAETVKTFSPQLQIEVKSDIFKIINVAERRNVQLRSTIVDQTPLFGSHSIQPSFSPHTTMPQASFQQPTYHQPYFQPQSQDACALNPAQYSQPQTTNSVTFTTLPPLQFAGNADNITDKDNL